MAENCSEARQNMATGQSRKAWRLARGLIGVVIVAELIARFGIGLGDPPLTIRDPQIDYMFAPSRCYQRFHKRSCYNQWSMRAADFPRTKQGCESRVMVFGDSIVNGGVSVDQSAIATEVARQQLATAGFKSTVGNVSAGSWGPANLLAYTQRFGWFDADVAVLVFNSGDVGDVPDFFPDLGPDQPSETPPFALAELFARYLPRYVPFLARRVPVPGEVLSPEQQRARGIAALNRLLSEAKSHVAHTIVLLHFEAGELAGGIADEDLVRELSERAGARFISLRSVEAPALYSDHIHLNAAGQAILGEVISEAVKPLLSVCPG